MTQTTNAQLLRWHDELKHLSTGNSILYHFNGSKIREFYNKNHVRLDSLLEKINSLRNDFFSIKDGQIEITEKDGKKEPVLLEGKIKAEFESKYKELMESEITVTL